MSEPDTHQPDTSLVVAFCIEELSVGGAEQMLVGMANEFVKRGWSVHVVCLTKAGELAGRLDAAVQLHVLDKKTGVDIKLCWRLRKCVAQIKPDVINAHLWVANAWSRISLLGCKVPIIVTEHSRDSWKPRHYRWLDRLLARKAARMVAVSKDTADFYVNTIGIRESLICVINNGVDTALYANGQGSEVRCNWLGRSIDDTSAKPRPFLIGTVGRLVPAKNHLRLIDACAALINDSCLSAQVKIVLKIVGEGPERGRLQQHIEKLGLGHRISLSGERHDIPDVLSSFDLFVLSSDREGHPLTALEAQSAGTPVVLTDAGGSSEAIAREGSNVGGVLVEPDVEALSHAIRQMIMDPKLLREYGLFAQDYARTYFDKMLMLDRYESLFSAALTANEP